MRSSVTKILRSINSYTNKYHQNQLVIGVATNAISGTRWQRVRDSHCRTKAYHPMELLCMGC